MMSNCFFYGGGYYGKILAKYNKFVLCFLVFEPTRLACSRTHKNLSLESMSKLKIDPLFTLYATLLQISH